MISNDYSIKNIELKKSIPIYGDVIEETTDEYDLRVPDEFKISFLANKRQKLIFSGKQTTKLKKLLCQLIKPILFSRNFKKGE